MPPARAHRFYRVLVKFKWLERGLAFKSALPDFVPKACIGLI